MNLSIYRFNALSLHRFIALYHYHCIALSLYRFIALSLYRFIALSLHRFIALSLYPSIALSLYRFIPLSLYGFIVLSVCRSSAYPPIRSSPYPLSRSSDYSLTRLFNYQHFHRCIDHSYVKGVFCRMLVCWYVFFTLHNCHRFVSKKQIIYPKGVKSVSLTVDLRELASMCYGWLFISVCDIIIVRVACLRRISVQNVNRG